MLKLVVAVVLTAAWVAGLLVLVTPGISSIPAGLESGKRIALEQYAALAER